MAENVLCDDNREKPETLEEWLNSLGYGTKEDRINSGVTLRELKPDYQNYLEDFKYEMACSSEHVEEDSCCGIRSIVDNPGDECLKEIIKEYGKFLLKAVVLNGEVRYAELLEANGFLAVEGSWKNPNTGSKLTLYLRFPKR